MGRRYDWAVAARDDLFRCGIRLPLKRAVVSLRTLFDYRRARRRIRTCDSDSPAYLRALISSGAPGGTGYLSTTNSIVSMLKWPMVPTVSTTPRSPNRSTMAL